MCTGPNEKPVICDNTCEHTCKNNILKIEPSKPCKAVNCKPGCDCKTGYLRDPDEKCVPESECGNNNSFFN